MRLYDRANRRLYINAAERARFLAAAEQLPPDKRAFCLTLVFTGCRISEALALTPSAIQAEARVITLRTLKRRRDDVYREVPVPPRFIDALEQLTSEQDLNDAQLWGDTNRITAYRWVKETMHQAKIIGAQACPKGLRHGYGIRAVQSGVQLNMLQKWMGHASMSTTAIYADACGAEEQEIADRMWRG
jgi:integrase